MDRSRSRKYSYREMEIWQFERQIFWGSRKITCNKLNTLNNQLAEIEPHQKQLQIISAYVSYVKYLPCIIEINSPDFLNIKTRFWYLGEMLSIWGIASILCFSAYTYRYMLHPTSCQRIVIKTTNILHSCCFKL